MKLSTYAKQQGISYSTALRGWKAGQIKGYRVPFGTIIVLEEQPHSPVDKVVIYARVSSTEHRENNADLMADRVAIVSRFTARLYGPRGEKCKAERIVQKLEAEDATR